MKSDVMKAIRNHCLDCCCNQPKEVRLCPDHKCALYPYRMGKDPYATRQKEDGETGEN